MTVIVAIIFDNLNYDTNMNTMIFEPSSNESFINIFARISGINGNRSVLLVGFDGLSWVDTIFVIFCTIHTHSYHTSLTQMEINSQQTEYLGA